MTFDPSQKGRCLKPLTLARGGGVVTFGPGWGEVL